MKDYRKWKYTENDKHKSTHKLQLIKHKIHEETDIRSNFSHTQELLSKDKAEGKKKQNIHGEELSALPLTN